MLHLLNHGRSSTTTTRRRIFPLSLPVFAIVLLSTLHLVAAQQIDCKNCFCAHWSNPYELQCPGNTSMPNLIINAKRNDYIKLNCVEDIPWDELYIPEIPVGDANSLFITTCYLPKNLMQVLDRFGTKSLKKLKIDKAINEQTVLRKELFENYKMLESLNVISSNLDYVETDALSDLVELEEITFRSNNLELAYNIFSNNVKLLDLELGQNKIKTIPENFFANLSKLRRLNLWSNDLDNVTSDSFHPLVNLYSLDLSRNKFKTFNSDIFVHLQNLKDLSLSHNSHLTSLPKELFQNNTLLASIRLNDNSKLTSLPQGLLSNLVKLQNVTMFRCNLLHLPGDLFKGSVNMQKIEMDRNKLRSLPTDIFDGLVNLVQLNLQFNEISSLPDNVFSSLKGLKILKLHNNKLTALENYMFNSMQLLEELHLENNRIEIIKENTFHGVSNLKLLYLSNNMITLSEKQNTSPFPLSPFNALLNLEEVYLNNNLLTEINEDWTQTKTHLKKLDLSHNKIKFIGSVSLQSVSKYALEMHLEYNEIEQIELWLAEANAKAEFPPSDAYNEKGTESGIDLYIEGNPIHCDCFAYDLARYFNGDIYPGLKAKLNIKTGNLTCATGVTYGRPITQLNPKYLVCELNQFKQNYSVEDCPDNCTCQYRPWDASLIISCNDKTFSEYPQFKQINYLHFNHTEINLSDNQLTEFPPNSTFFMNVTKLYLGNNSIIDVPWLPPKLEILELQNNNISRLTSDELSLLNTSIAVGLKNISLYGNPWTCDCETANFRSFIQYHIQSISSSNQIMCDSSNTSILRLQNEDLCPSFTNLIIILCVIITIVAVGLGVSIAMYYRHQHDIKVWLYMHKLTRWLVTEDEVDRNKIYDAFISYSHKDEDFVAKHLVPVLEGGPQPYKLCLHGRDWTPGELIPNNIVRSVEESRRTIIVLSKSFLESMWGILEFRTAHTQAVTEGRARVIVILYEDVDIEQVDEEMKNYLKMNTYVKWGDPWFWNKLKYALPHSKVMQRRVQLKQNLMMTLDDKLDLICVPTSIPNASTPPAASLDPLVLKVNPLDFIAAKKSDTNS